MPRMQYGGGMNSLSSSEREEVGPTEDTILALLDFLVDPLLPSGSSSSKENLSPFQEELVAKQVHAVVLLYNYYHRKRHPMLEFLEFESLCKMALGLKPSLLSYLKLMQRVDHAELLDDMDEHLSLTEKTIKNACDIAKSLDASNNKPIIKGWPISKVAVFLVDSNKENCFLFHSSITQGVWSVIEKDVNVPSQSSEAITESRPGNKKKRAAKGKPKGKNHTVDEAGLQQLACLAVKEACGINQEDLKTLETHLVHSISKEKTVVRLYIMQCAQTNQDVNLVPIKDAMDSLRGPLVRKESGSWILTPVVEYFHLLPFADEVSDWLSRESVPNTSEHCKTVKQDESRNSLDLKAEPLLNTHISSEHFETEKDVRNRNSSHLEDDQLLNTSQPFEAGKEVTNGNSCHLNEEPLPHTSKHSEAAREVENNYSSPETVVYKKRNRYDTNCSSGKTPGSKISIAIVEFSRQEDDECAGTGSSNNMDIDESFKTCSPVDGKSKSLPCQDSVDDQKQTILAEETDQVAVTEGAIVVADVLDSLPSTKEDNVEKFSYDNKNSDTATFHQDEKQGRALVSLDSDFKHLQNMQLTIASKENLLSQTALKVLFRKREILTLQLRNIADEIALCDGSIQTILSGNEDDLAIKLDSIIEGCNDVSLRSAAAADDRIYLHFQDQDMPRVFKRKRLPEANLSVFSPCQELDGICNENSWILPSYHVSASEGRFRASVSAKGVDFESSSEGAICATPREARNSAASKMLVKLRTMEAES